MAAPQSVHQDTRAALHEVYQILRGAALRARQQANDGPQATTDTAGSIRPLAGGDHPTQHNARAIPTKGNAGAVEDSHRDQLTSAAN